MNILIFCLVIIDAWTDVLVLINPKKKVPISGEILPEGGFYLDGPTAKTWVDLITPGPKKQIDDKRVKEVLDIVLPSIRRQYAMKLKEEATCEECDVYDFYEFVYEENKRMAEIFDILEERYGSKHVSDHRKKWFDRKSDSERLILDNFM